jgi:acyl carrier protein
MANLNKKNLTISKRPGPVDPKNKIEPVGLPLLQKSVLDMWCEVLKVETIDLHTTFLDAGGDSILATLLSIRIENNLGIKVSLLDLFDAPTIIQQAEMLQTRRENHTEGSSYMPLSLESTQQGRP